jgi:copper resistance protein C
VFAKGGSRHARGLPLVLVISALLVGPWSATAHAHAERVGSDPKESAELPASPTQLSIDFTEPPTGDANLVVMDGCQNDVVRDIQVQNMRVSATLAEGEPGKWAVRSTVVSGIDGHQTRDSWTFTVRGEKDCSSARPDADRNRAGENEEAEGSSFPVVPLAIAVLGVLLLALLLRALTGRSSE